MKTSTFSFIFVCGLFFFPIFIKSSINRLNVNQSKNEIPDSSFFSYKNIQNTFILRCKDFPKLINTTKNQCNIWIRPFFNKEFNTITHDNTYSIIKLISYQQKQKNYYTIIVMLDDEIPEFYLLTINNHGLFIDGTIVSTLKNLSNDEITKDNTDNSYIYSTEINSEFIGDTIIKIKKVSKSFNSDAHEENEFWEESYNSKFIIDSIGKISNLTPYLKIN